MTGPCKKCGAGPIVGPRYVTTSDELSYHCATCGYSFTRPCADAKTERPYRLQCEQGGKDSSDG